MTRATQCLLLFCTVLLAPSPAATGQEKWWHRWFGDSRYGTAAQIADDEKLLQGASVKTDARGLADFLNSLSSSKEDEDKIGKLFKQLGSNKFAEREQATAALTSVGPKAIPILKRLLPGPTLEVRMRTERCLKVLEQKWPATLSAAAVRLFKARKPDDGVTVLLHFAPFAPEEAVSEEILDAIFVLGIRDGKADAALDKVLRDPAAPPARRAIAAVLLGRFGDDGQRKEVTALLDAKDAEVRVGAAQGLLARGERLALPVLVEALKNAPPHLAERAEELLAEVAGATAPKVPLGFDEATRKKCHTAWHDWLQAHQAKVDLSNVVFAFPLPSAETRAREVVKQFIELAVKPDRKDKEKLARLTDIPFYQAGQKTINTREEWEQQFNMDQPPPEGLKYKLEIKKTFNVADYLGSADPSEKELLERVSPAEVRVVLVLFDVSFMDQRFSMTIPMYVRVSGARGRIFGMGMPKDVSAEKK